MNKLNKDKIIGYVFLLFAKNEGFFDYSKYCKGTVLSTDFAVSALNLLLGCDVLNAEKDKIIEYLKKSVNDNILIVDKKFDILDTSGNHKEDYIKLQSTFFTLIALDILGVKFDNLLFIEKYFEEDVLTDWFDNLDWSRFWYESNKIMFMMYFFSYIIFYGNDNNKNQAKKCIEICFDVLNKKQDKNTGYWGTNLNGNNLVDGAFGAAHIFLFYDYFKKEIQYKKKIIDSTLTLHSENGFFGDEGGACEDYDLIEIYLRVLKQTDYKKSEIIEELKKIRNEIINSQNKDGGFSYKFYKPKSVFEKIFKSKSKKVTYKYSSWNKMETPVYFSDLWGTYFRSLSLVALDLLIDNKKEYNSYHLPGWGYIE